MKIRAKKIAREVARFARKNGTDVMLQWRVYAPGYSVDPVTQEIAGVFSVATKKVRAVGVYFVSASKTGLRTYTELETGDVIIDFPATVPIDNLAHLEFVIEGEVWRQKTLGPAIAKAWDAIVGGIPLGRVVAGTKAVVADLPALGTSPPQVVRYVGLGGFAMDLYRYDGANQLFVEINPGVPANFVTIVLLRLACVRRGRRAGRFCGK
jgi:hypothetical protein